MEIWKSTYCKGNYLTFFTKKEFIKVFFINSATSKLGSGANVKVTNLPFIVSFKEFFFKSLFISFIAMPSYLLNREIRHGLCRN